MRSSLLRGLVAARMAAVPLVAALLGSLPPLEVPAQEGPSEVATQSAAAPEELAPALERLDKLEFDLGRSIESAQLDLASAERRFAAAQARLDAELEPDATLRAEVAARRLQLSSAQRILSLLQARLERVQGEKQTRRRLHDLSTRQLQIQPEALAEWGADNVGDLEGYARRLAVERSRLEELRQELAFTLQRRDQLPAGSNDQRWVAVQVQALESLIDQYEKDLSSLTAAQDLQLELSASLEQRSRDLPLGARLRALLHQLRVFWNYELTASEDEPITPGKILSALAIFLIGYLVAGLVSRLLGARVFPRMRLEEGAADAFQSLAFYLLLLVAFLTALRMVQIPLGAFAVLGGALAIGVGFGSQNVVGNFISGLILLIERPIKLGDLIEVEGVYGSVERIGLRSTRVRTGDNIHIIVPNASFLESKVINWTHTDPRVRIRIEVGVVYGSPTREVERLILEALEDHPRVLGRPEPLVLFKEFGDNALLFEACFWIEMRTTLDRLRVESDLRFRIDEVFRKGEIVIAFPQRDVHLDTTAPLEIHLTQRERRTDVTEA